MANRKRTGWFSFSCALFYCLASSAGDYDPTRFEKEIIVPAWAYEREGGGRSFGTTLGHPFSNWNDWRIEPFRHMVLNGIRWTLGQSIAEKKTEQTNINH